jgi:acetyl esterase/lipase
MPVSTKHLIDPELVPALEQLAGFAVTPEILPLVRAQLAEVAKAVKSIEDPTLALTERFIPGPAGAPEVRVLVYRPTQAAGLVPAVLHIHPGGYLFGQPEMSDPRNRQVVRDLGAVVVSVDYRLAPETQHPGPVEDCYAALAWLHRNAAELGVDRKRIAVVGESAGGGCAAALTLLARDRGEFAISFQSLTYPMLDDRTCVLPEPHLYAGEFVWTPMANVFGWTSLLGCAPGGANVSPYAAPARSDNLTGLPPAYITTGALDLFLEENLDYARRLTRAGVPTELHVYPGAFHGFDVSPDAGVTQRAQRDWFAALKRALAA